MAITAIASAVSNLAQGRAGEAEGKGAEGKSWGTPLPPPQEDSLRNGEGMWRPVNV